MARSGALTLARDVACSLAGTMGLTQVGVEVGCLTGTRALARTGAGARSVAGASAGARAGHGAAGEGMGHGTGVPFIGDIHPGCVEDIFKLLPTKTHSKSGGFRRSVRPLIQHFLLSSSDLKVHFIA